MSPERERYIRQEVAASLDSGTVQAIAAKARGGGGIPDHVHQRAELLAEIDNLREELDHDRPV